MKLKQFKHDRLKSIEKEFSQYVTTVVENTEHVTVNRTGLDVLQSNLKTGSLNKSKGVIIEHLNNTNRLA